MGQERVEPRRRSSKACRFALSFGVSDSIVATESVLQIPLRFPIEMETLDRAYGKTFQWLEDDNHAGGDCLYCEPNSVLLCLF